jgi:hypothetical protein
MLESPLHITVAVTPHTEFGNPRILDHDLRLAKASILYADKVKLCSMSAWMATSFYLMGNLPMNEAQQMEMIIGLASALSSYNQTAANILPELQKLHRLFKQSPVTLTKKERLKKSAFKPKLSEIWEELQTAFNSNLDNFGFDEVELAANNGVLEIHPFGNTDTEEIANEYMSAVEEMYNEP